ncbi:MAG: DUF1015 domain-containing protein [Bacteroidetes bacterium]|nr:DUF1015 domain-containing protein [Bacteroidota bacterium]MDA1268485.1 DUF1015 domain-containing protein [Bacteroidota bacterium]
MAELLPLRAWRYTDELGEQLEKLTAPLFDVVTSKQREILYQNPLNSIHLSVPQGDNGHLTAKKLVKQWKSEGILVQDDLPSIYVYFQYFRLPGEKEERCRKGFIAQIKATDWEEKVILRHENTIVSAVNDRVDLLRATEIQVSPTHGLYEDLAQELEPWMDKAMEKPLYELEDYQGVREVFARITDSAIIGFFLKTLAPKKVILADGHHRLEAAIAYRKEQSEVQISSSWKASDYHLMYLTNVYGNHLEILPTHRLYYGEGLEKETFFKAIEEWFEIRSMGDAAELSNYSFQRKNSFGLVWEDAAYIIKFRQDKFDQVAPSALEVLRQLDLVLLHDVVFDKLLGLSPDQQRNTAFLSFERNFSRCVQEVQSGNAKFAIITREIQLSQVMEVCNSGQVMPQKSTYFYPKALGGMLFATVNQEEFNYDYTQYFS